MTNDVMTELWELANSSFDDLKNTCKKRCKTCRHSDSFGFIHAKWPCLTCYGNPIYPHLKGYPDHYEKLVNFGE